MKRRFNAPRFGKTVPALLSALWLIAQPTQAPAASRDLPCRLAENFTVMHIELLATAQQIREADETVKALRTTSRSSPYKRIEQQGVILRARSKQALNALSNMVIELDDAPDTPEKATALNLIASYWNASELLADYADTILLYEREENLASMSVNGRSFLTFGVNKGAPQVAGDNYARDQLEEKVDEPQEALRLMPRAERRYDNICGVTKRQARVGYLLR